MVHAECSLCSCSKSLSGVPTLPMAVLGSLPGNKRFLCSNIQEATCFFASFGLIKGSEKSYRTQKLKRVYYYLLVLFFFAVFSFLATFICNTLFNTLGKLCGTALANSEFCVYPETLGIKNNREKQGAQSIQDMPSPETGLNLNPLILLLLFFHQPAT